MTDKEKIADAANNMENKYIKNIPENFWSLRFLDQYMQGHKGFIAGGCFKNILSREKMQYGVFDSVGKLLRYFNTYKQAETFKISRQRYDWSIKQIWVK